MSVYAQLWDARAEYITTAAEEVELIARAATGDPDAMTRLFACYVPHLRQAVGRYTRVLPLDDARQAAWLGLASAVRAFDPTRADRLNAVIRPHVESELSAAAREAGAGFAVPSRTLDRFFGILAKAGGDVVEAARIAPEHEMTAETFRDVLAAVNAGASLDEAVAAYGDNALGVLVSPREIADAEDRVLTDLAFRAVDDFERDVCRLKYGFTDESYGDEMSDDAVGYHLGVSRLKAQRTRTRALGKMRRALGALNV